MPVDKIAPCNLDPAVMQMLQEDLPEQLASFQRAWEENELQAARAQVHAIHGSAAFCKLETLRLIAATLEDSLNNSNRNAELASAFEDCIKQTLQLLEKQINHTQGQKEN